MRFSLQTLLLAFLLIWSALAAFGPWGLVIAAVLLAIVAYLRSANSIKEALKRLLIVFVMLLLVCCLLMPNISRAREAARRVQCSNNLKQIGLALHNYHDVHGTFPPAYFADPNGKPMHSWRVLILPFMEQKPLYDEYDFSEPWDGPNNSKLASAAMTPYAYQCPSNGRTGSSAMTSYVAITGPGTGWPEDKCRKFSDFASSANTIVVAEKAGSGIHWMEPRDLPLEDVLRGINPEAQGGLSSRHPSGGGYFHHGSFGVNALMADGSVHFVYEGVDPATLKQLFEIGDKPPIDFGELRRVPYKRKPNWAHIVGLTSLVLSLLLLLLRPRARTQPAPGADPKPPEAGFS